uniref:Transforming growth factor-beta-induced protein ig-h3-like n=1 Tax=Crassostrea virginica TaxID=6565 RepID=A0A8B8BA63_CRAVI|nr:transforming growth factor-beta-induced protein ig-h3-like [Crassostrea virginica]
MRWVCAVFALVFSVAAAQQGTIVDVAKRLGATTLLQLVEEAGLTDVLSSKGPFTVFAPTNAAFSALPPDVLQKLKSDKKLLTDVLLAHVVNKTTSSKTFKDDEKLMSMNKDAFIRINLYLPRYVRPIPPATVTANGCKVSMADQVATNGVVHVISRVMYPLPLKDNVVDVVRNTSSLSTLYKAIKATGVSDIIADGGPFTLLAPPDDAFSKLPPGTVDSILKNKTAAERIVTYHLIGGSYYKASLLPYNTSHPGVHDTFLPTLEGGQLVFSLDTDGSLVISRKYKVVKTDMTVGNGVIHTLDSVMIPPPFP